jgi:hypothetical protein
MGGGDGPSQEGSSQDDRGGGGLSTKGVDGSQAIDSRTHGPDDAPSSTGSAEGDRPCAACDDPERNVERRSKAHDDQSQGDQPHRFLGVIGSMAQRQGDRGEDLHPVEEVLGVRGSVSGEKKGDPEKEGPEEETQERGEDQDGDDVEKALPDNSGGSVGNQDGTHHPSHESVGRAGGEAEIPRDEVPADGSDESGHNERHGELHRLWIKGGDIHNVLPDRFRDRRSEEQGAAEFTDRRQEQSFPWRKGPGGNDGGHDIGRIVKPVGVIKEKGEPNNDNGDESDRDVDATPPLFSPRLLTGAGS